jgi:hypothetical protein
MSGLMEADGGDLARGKSLPDMVLLKESLIHVRMEN